MPYPPSPSPIPFHIPFSLLLPKSVWKSCDEIPVVLSSSRPSPPSVCSHTWALHRLTTCTSLLMIWLLTLLYVWTQECESIFHCGVVGFQPLVWLYRVSFFHCEVVEFQPRAGTFSIVFSLYYSYAPNAHMWSVLYLVRTDHHYLSSTSNLMVIQRFHVGETRGASHKGYDQASPP